MLVLTRKLMEKLYIGDTIWSPSSVSRGTRSGSGSTRPGRSRCSDPS
jgi:hypothetical protein